MVALVSVCSKRAVGVAARSWRAAGGVFTAVAVVAVSGGRLVAAFAVVMVVGLTAPLAHAQLALPDTGIDLTDYITLFGTGLGLVVAAVVGLIFAFMIIKRGLSWAKRAG